MNPGQIGSGLEIKAIEALAMGCPMVTTAIGAAGLQNGQEEAFLVADTPAAFSSAVVKILSSSELQVSMSRKAKLFASEYNQKALRPLLALLEAH